MRRNPLRWVLMGMAVVVCVIGVLALLALAVLLLWNALVPPLFHGPQLLYWQALGLLILCRLLFGGLRARGWHGHWRQRMWRERWARMTPEERAQLRERFLGRCGPGSAGAGAASTAPPA